MSLEDYRRKRDFARTNEPAPAGAGDGDRARFVVQEHHSTRLHWDLRLERGGVLKSWAVPNGFPATPDENRRAVHTEDHPLEYLDFHGTIPEGNYGAGTMTIWDRGTYEVHKWEPGKVVLTFHGERLQGRHALFRAGRTEQDWLLHRMDPPADLGREPLPEQCAPMLAKPGPLPTRPPGGWRYEVKWDGIRVLVRSEPGRLKLVSRQGNDLTSQYPELRPLNRALSSHAALLDGEIVAFDADGRPSFHRLQQRMHLTRESEIRRQAQHNPVVLVLFDLLHLDGRSLLRTPYDERREQLLELGLDDGHWRTPAAHDDGEALLAATAEQRLEGVIAKRRDSCYEPGRRTGAWVKVKHLQSEQVVIGGWLPGEGRRRDRIGALVVGTPEPGGGLRYAGRVGTGFTQAELERLHERLAPLARAASPFTAGAAPPKPTAFVEPALHARVEFTEWTPDGVLRHPSYKGLVEAAEPTLEELVARGRVLQRGKAVEIDVAGRALRLTNLDKVLYPGTGFTKGEVIDYYRRIAPVLLPHLEGRPITLKRYPDGVDGQSFYEKNCPRHRPDWLPTLHVPLRTKAVDFCLLEEPAALVWTANLAAIELHPSLARGPGLDRPTMVVFDLDPGPPATIVECCRIALWLRGLFEQLGLRCYAKTSGSKGMQVYLPLNTGGVTYDDTKPFAQAIAALLEQRAPELVVSLQSKELRPGKVLIDWSQNDEHKTTVGPYVMRARARPTVSTPVDWDEVEACLDAGDPELLVFTAGQVLERVEERGDLFAPALGCRQELPALG